MPRQIFQLKIGNRAATRSITGGVAIWLCTSIICNVALAADYSNQRCPSQSTNEPREFSLWDAAMNDQLKIEMAMGGCYPDPRRFCDCTQKGNDRCCDGTVSQ